MFCPVKFYEGGGGISKEEKIMKQYHNIKKICFEKDKLKITIDNNLYEFELKNISKKLLNSSDQERNAFEISPSGYGIHWPVIDEDLSIDGLLGRRHKVKEKVGASRL
jgi:hypothetical protein